MFVKNDGFRETAEIPSPKDFGAVMYCDFRQGKSFQPTFQSYFEKVEWASQEVITRARPRHAGTYRLALVL